MRNLALVSMGSAAVELLSPLLMKAALDRAVAGRAAEVGLHFAGWMVAIALLRYGFEIVRKASSGTVSLEVQHHLRVGLLSSLESQDGRGQDRMRIGELTARLLTDLQMIQGFVSAGLFAICSVIQTVLAIAVMFWLSPVLALVAVAMVPTILIYMTKARRTVLGASWMAQQSISDANQHLVESIEGIRVVKAFGQEDSMVAGRRRHAARILGERMRVARANSRFAPTMSAIPSAALVTVIAVGGLLTYRGDETVGTFLAFVTYVTMVAGTTGVIAGVLVSAQLSRAAVERVEGVLRAEVGPTGPGVALGPGRLSAEMCEVRFGFDSSDTPDRCTPVLDGLSMRVGPGDLVAVLGRSGAGRSTIAQMFAGFYVPEEGSLVLRSQSADPEHPDDPEHPADAVDSRDVSLEELRGRIVVVFDEPFLFAGTIADAIALGRPDASASEIRRAAALAHAVDFIDALPDGFDTEIGERAGTLSGGEKQRIALARAILLDPDILVLDNATSAIDAITEATILAGLRDHRRESATLVFSNRASALRNASHVAVLDRGHIVCEGSLAEVREQSAVVRELMGELEEVPLSEQAVEANSDPASAVSTLWRADPAAQVVDPARGAGAVSPQIADAIMALPPIVDAEPAYEPDREDHRDFRIMRLLRKVRTPLLISLVCVIIESIVALGFPVIARVSVDGATLDRSISVLLAGTVAGTLLVVVNWFVGAVLTVTSSRASEQVMFRLRVLTFDHLQRQGLRYFERESPGQISTRMTTDIDSLSLFLQSGLTSSLVEAMTIVGVSVALVLADVSLGLMVLSAVIPAVIATLIFRTVARRSYLESRHHIAAVSASFQENIAGLRTAQAYRFQTRALAGFTRLSRRYTDSRRRTQWISGIYFPFIALLADLGTVIVMIGGARAIANGDLTPGAFVAITLYLGMLFAPIQQLSQGYDAYQQASVGLGRIKEFLAQPPESPAGAGELRLRDRDVRLAGVGFRYSDAGAAALSEVDLTIDAGTTTAVVGSTGAGKSTVLKLLARFYEPTTGAILVGGDDVRAVSAASYRDRVGLVPQDNHLFSGTVAENIAFADPAAAPSEIVAAATNVGALEMITALPLGMDHVIREGGRGLSAGQRQLIALARAELVAPELLLLDEATAALDPLSERRVLDAIGLVSSRRTTVVVAHRLATAMRADQIAVVEGGRVVERGGHHELLATGGRYADLWRAAQGETVPV